jgi:hypothetical protein
MKLPQWLSKRSLSEVLTVVSVIFVVINFVCDYGRNQEANQRALQIDTLQYRVSAAEHHPLIKLVGIPVIEKAWLGGKVYTRSTLFMPGSREAKSDTSYLGTLDTVTISFRVINSSDHHAILRLEALIDTSSFDSILREKAISGINPKESELSYSDRPHEIPPHDSTTLTLTTTVFSQSGSTFTLHYLLLYQNSLNQIFDSYFWIQATKGEVKIWREFRDSAGV